VLAYQGRHCGEQSQFQHQDGNRRGCPCQQCPHRRSEHEQRQWHEVAPSIVRCQDHRRSYGEARHRHEQPVQAINPQCYAQDLAVGLSRNCEQEFHSDAANGNGNPATR